MSGLEITALSVVCVVLYVAGAGVTWRLCGAPEDAPPLELGHLLCGCFLSRNYAGETKGRCVEHGAQELKYDVAWWSAALWPVVGMGYVGYGIVRGLALPLTATFRVCAGLHKPRKPEAG